MTDMRMRADPSTGYPGRTYRFYNGSTVFKFGYGLSYTKYSYTFNFVSRITQHFLQSSTHESVVRTSGPVGYISVSDLGTDSCKNIQFPARVKVSNIGGREGKHPILLFVRNEKVGSDRPRKQLVGFQSVRLKRKQTVEVKFVVNPCEHLSHGNEAGSMVIEKGRRYLVVGDEEYPIDVVF